MAISAITLFGIEFFIATKLAHHHFIRGYGGDFLVVILLYAIVQAIRPMKPIVAGVGLMIFSTSVEFIQMIDPAKLLGFAKGSAGEIIMGSTFSVEDILMYLGGITTIVIIDSIIISRKISK